MPVGHRVDGKIFNPIIRQWVKLDKQKVFDYDALNNKAGAFAISFFRWYPDYFADMCRTPHAKYKLEFPQRMIMRIFARYRNTYITGSRGLTKTYCVILEKMIEGILYPGEVMRYIAPKQRQAVVLAKKAFSVIQQEYPLIAEHWNIDSASADIFRISTQFHSEFSMYSPQGDNCAQTIAEEIGQEGDLKSAFDMEQYERVVVPTRREERKVNQRPDRAHINFKAAHITNACTRSNPAFTKHRYNALKDMLYGKTSFEGYAVDISWETSLICNLRDIEYIKDMKRTLTPSDWLQQMCACYTGTGENPMLSEEVVSQSRRLNVAELRHCGDKDAIYIVSHDVAYAEGRVNALCADVVLKLTQPKEKIWRDRYKKQCVFADTYTPPATDYLQAQKVRKLWERYCLNGGNTTYLVIDAQAYGTGVVEELMKPTGDGSPPLCCVGHLFGANIEQPGALPVIYPLKSGSRGVRDEESTMIQYAQREFEQGLVELLTPNIVDGVEEYKRVNRVKDDIADSVIVMPYKNTELLCQQISNLQTQVSGFTMKEKRRSKSIQRDIWSALKYGLRMAARLEMENSKERYTAKSSWAELIADFTQSGASVAIARPKRAGARANLLALRKR